MIKRILIFKSLLIFSASLAFADETDEEILARILKEAVTIVINSKIIMPENDKSMLAEISKVTVPGRKVTLIFEGDNEKLNIELTPFKVEDGSYLLAALSNLWIENESGGKYKSSYRSISLKKDELILFYPLGLEAQEALTGGSIYLELGIKIIPYIPKNNQLPE